MEGKIIRHYNMLAFEPAVIFRIDSKFSKIHIASALLISKLGYLRDKVCSSWTYAMVPTELLSIPYEALNCYIENALKAHAYLLRLLSTVQRDTIDHLLLYN